MIRYFHWNLKKVELLQIICKNIAVLSMCHMILKYKCFIQISWATARNFSNSTSYPCLLPVNVFTFVVVSQGCLHGCSCSYSPWKKVNIFNCTSRHLTRLPETIQENTEWFIASHNQFGHIKVVEDYMCELVFMDMSSNNIEHIGSDVMSALLENTLPYCSK